MGAALAGRRALHRLGGVGQDQSAATPKDVIFARKILMDLIGRKHGRSRSHDSVREDRSRRGPRPRGQHLGDADGVPASVPANRNEWKPNVERDPGRDTFASPELWTNFADFYKRAAAASKVAYETSRADKPDQFKTIVGELRVACNSCHGIYFKQP